MAAAVPRPAGTLSDSCSICHQPPKYRCPACSARTCSLECSQRHKRRAQCSGVRAPVSYLTRAQLAARPEALRADFDLLTNIERRLADGPVPPLQVKEPTVSRRNAPSPADESSPAAPQSPVELSHPQIRPHLGADEKRAHRRLQKAYHDRQVAIVKAPVGMSRQRRNQTAWDGRHGAIAWTIEWIRADGRTSYGQALEMWDARRNWNQPAGTETNACAREGNGNATGAGARADDEALADGQVKAPAPANDASVDTEMHFYLQLIPQPPKAPRRVLYLRRGRLLRDCFRSRTFLEFPTIYVLDRPPEKLDPELYAVDNVIIDKGTTAG